MMPLAARFDSGEALLAALVERIENLVDSGRSTPIVLIDGRAGAGKSTLAEHLQNALFRTLEVAPRVVHMDDLYPGWDGLEAGADFLYRFILNPLSRGEQPSWQVYDWAKGQRDGWREFAGGTPLIVEGCGSLNQRSAELADLSVWIEVDEAERLRRWIEREGDDSHWAGWAAQELDLYARERSIELASTVYAPGS